MADLTTTYLPRAIQTTTRGTGAGGSGGFDPSLADFANKMLQLKLESAQRRAAIEKRDYLADMVRSSHVENPMLARVGSRSAPSAPARTSGDSGSGPTGENLGFARQEQKARQMMQDLALENMAAETEAKTKAAPQKVYFPFGGGMPAYLQDDAGMTGAQRAVFGSR